MESEYLAGKVDVFLLKMKWDIVGIRDGYGDIEWRLDMGESVKRKRAEKTTRYGRSLSRA